MLTDARDTTFCTELPGCAAAFHAPAELSGWLRCFHSKFGRESLSILMTLPIVAARCRCSLGKIRRARTHCKLLRRLPYVPRPPEFCGKPQVGLQILPMALHARRIPSSLFAAACSENAERLAPRTIFVHGASSSSDLALVYCMRLSISWLLPNGWLAAPVRRRFHCTAHLFCRTPLVGLHIFHSVAVRQERPTHCTVQSGC